MDRILRSLKRRVPVASQNGHWYNKKTLKKTRFIPVPICLFTASTRQIPEESTTNTT